MARISNDLISIYLFLPNPSPPQCRLATEQEVLAAKTKADDLERENCDLVNMLALKEQELDLKVQQKEDSDAALNRLKEKFERETMSHMEAKQKISDLETYLNEVGQQLHTAQQDKMRLEHILNTSGTSIPDDAKARIKDLQFSPPPGISFMNGSKSLDGVGVDKMPPPPPPPPLLLLNGPPPPPPPGMPLMNSAPARPLQPKKQVPPSSVPLKCFNWTKIPDAKVGGTIWTELDEAKLYKVIDLGEFDQLFSAYQKNGLNHHVRRRHFYHYYYYYYQTFIRFIINKK